MGFSPRIKKSVSDIDALSEDNIAADVLSEENEETVSEVSPTSEEVQPETDSMQQTVD